MIISPMPTSMIMTFTTENLKELITDYLKKKNIAVLHLQPIIDMQAKGDQRDSWTEGVFQGIRAEVSCNFESYLNK